MSDITPRLGKKLSAILKYVENLLPDSGRNESERSSRRYSMVVTPPPSEHANESKASLSSIPLIDEAPGVGRGTAMTCLTPTSTVESMFFSTPPLSNAPSQHYGSSPDTRASITSPLSQYCQSQHHIFQHVHCVQTCLNTLLLQVNMLQWNPLQLPLQSNGSTCSSSSQRVLGILGASSRLAQSVSSLLSVAASEIVSSLAVSESLPEFQDYSHKVWNTTSDIVRSTRLICDQFQAHREHSGLIQAVETECQLLVSCLLAYMEVTKHIMRCIKLKEAVGEGLIATPPSLPSFSPTLGDNVLSHFSTIKTRQSVESQTRARPDSPTLPQRDSQLHHRRQTSAINIAISRSGSIVRKRSGHQLSYSTQTTASAYSLGPEAVEDAMTIFRVTDDDMDDAQEKGVAVHDGQKQPDESLDLRSVENHAIHVPNTASTLHQEHCSLLFSENLDWSPTEIWDAAGARRGSELSLQLRPFSIERSSVLQERQVKSHPADINQGDVTNEENALRENNDGDLRAKLFAAPEKRPEPLRTLSKRLFEPLTSMRPGSAYMAAAERNDVMEGLEGIASRRASKAPSVFSLRSIASTVGTKQSSSSIQSKFSRLIPSMTALGPRRTDGLGNLTPRKMESSPNLRRTFVRATWGKRKRTGTIKGSSAAETECNPSLAESSDQLYQVSSPGSSKSEPKLGDMCTIWGAADEGLNIEAGEYCKTSHAEPAETKVPSNEASSQPTTPGSGMEVIFQTPSPPGLAPPRPAFLMTTSYEGSVAADSMYSKGNGSSGKLSPSSDDNGYEQSVWESDSDSSARHADDEGQSQRRLRRGLGLLKRGE